MAIDRRRSWHLLVLALFVPLTANAIVVLNCEELTPPPNCYDCAVGHDIEGVVEYRWSKNKTWGHFSPSSGITQIPYATYHCPNPGVWTGSVLSKRNFTIRLGPRSEALPTQ